MNGMDAKQDMQALWDAEIAIMNGRAQTTIISYITKYRNAIREAFGDDHPMLKIATGDAAMYDEARRVKMEKIANKHGALITFENYRQVLKICEDCLKSSDPLMIGIGLIGMTGRRPYEVFTQAEFSPAPYGKGVSKWSILFNGQAKTKQGEGTKFGITYEIPVLTRSETVLAAYKRLRESGQENYGMACRSTIFPRKPACCCATRFLTCSRMSGQRKSFPSPMASDTSMPKWPITISRHPMSPRTAISPPFLATTITTSKRRCPI